MFGKDPRHLSGIITLTYESILYYNRRLQFPPCIYQFFFSSLIGIPWKNIFLLFAYEHNLGQSAQLNQLSVCFVTDLLSLYFGRLVLKVSSKHAKGGKEFKMDVLVMENLLFRRRVTRVYDLKGSTRSRYNADTSGTNTVLLDQNLIEAMSTSPIFVGNKAKRVLERAVWNDTSFLAVSLNLIHLMLVSCKFRTSTITNFFSKVDDNFKHTSQS